MDSRVSGIWQNAAFCFWSFLFDRGCAMSFRMAFFMCISVGRFRCRFVFLFWGRRAFIYVEKQGFRHLFSTVRSRFSVFWYGLPASSADIGKSLSAEWFLVRLKAISENAAWKQKTSFLHGFLLTFGSPLRETSVFCSGEEWGGHCLFVGVLFLFLTFCSQLSAGAVCHNVKVFGICAGFRWYALKMIQETKYM